MGSVGESKKVRLRLVVDQDVGTADEVKWARATGGLGVEDESNHSECDDQEDAYFSEPEREVSRSGSSCELRRRATAAGIGGEVNEYVPAPCPHQESPQDLFKRPRNRLNSDFVREGSSSSSPSPVRVKRVVSEPNLSKCREDDDFVTPCSASGIDDASTADSHQWNCSAKRPASGCCRRLCKLRVATPWRAPKHTSPEPRKRTNTCQADAEEPMLSFSAWLQDEVRGRPEEAQFPAPHSHLEEVAKVPKGLEKVLFLGLLLCLDILLHELSFTPLQVMWASPRLMTLRKLSITEKGDILRLTLLMVNVLLVMFLFDVSWVYHYIRGESFLKLYVVFNMLELFERWLRSGGCDLFDLLMASMQQSWISVLPKYVVTIVYCFAHSTMHLVRILLLNVAINTSSSAMFLIIITNNFAEIKSTVFKKYEAKSLFPIVTSDIVERFYLLFDIIFVFVHLGISRKGTYGLFDITFWLMSLVLIELGTDWIKFCLISKFSELSASTLDVYKEVLIADILLSRTCNLAIITKDSMAKESTPALTVPFRGIHSFSHVPARRIGFSGVPMTTLVVIHLIMLFRSPCFAVSSWPRITAAILVASFFTMIVLAKILLGVFLLGFAVRRRKSVKKGLDLFPKIKAL